MTKLLGIAGSPRRGGTSERLLDAFLEGARSGGMRVEKIRVCDLRIAPCDESNACFKTGLCVIKDDMQWLYTKLLNTDHLVIATPTFFMGVPAQLKAMIDRCQALWARRFVLKKPLRKDTKIRSGFLIGVSGLAKKEAFVGTKKTMKAFFYVLGFSFRRPLLFSGVDKSGDIELVKGALDKARKAGAKRKSDFTHRA